MQRFAPYFALLILLAMILNGVTGFATSALTPYLTVAQQSVWVFPLIGSALALFALCAWPLARHFHVSRLAAIAGASLAVPLGTVIYFAGHI